MNKKLLEQVVEFSGKPALFAKGTGNIWTEPHLSDQLNDPPKMVHRSTITLIIAFYMLTAELK